MKFLYHIVTMDGRKLKVEAESAQQALELLDIAQEHCRKWYPFAVKKLMSKTEREAIREHLTALRANPKYQENSKRNKRIRKRVKREICSRVSDIT